MKAQVVDISKFKATSKKSLLVRSSALTQMKRKSKMTPGRELALAMRAYWEDRLGPVKWKVAL